MKKFLLSIFAVMLAVFSVQAEEYSYTLAKGDGTTFGDVTWNEVEWNISADNTSYCQWDGSTSKGYQFGSSKQSCKTLTLSTSGIEGTITKIVVNTSGASSINASLTVSVGGIQYGNSTKLTSASTDYTFENTTSSASGEIKLSYANSSSKAIYIKSITVTYTTAGEGGGETPDVPEVQAPAAPTLTASCNFDNSMNVEITDIAEGATVYYTTDGTTPSETNGTEYTAPFEITATTIVKAVAVNEGGSSDVATATYTKNEPVTPPAGGEVVDVLNRELTGVSGTTYTSWSNKTATSSAVYAGQSAGGNDAIQLRSSNSNSGIITTKSGGKVKRIDIVWNSSTSGRTLNVYGKNTSYTSPTDLYDSNKQGTLLGQIVKANGRDTYIEVDGDYEYIGLRSNSGAMYIDEIKITWDASAGVTPVAPTVPSLTESQTFKGSLEVTITSDATVYYTTDGTTPSKTNGTEYTAPFEITATTTVKAVAVNEVGESEVAEATYTLFVVEETEGYYVKVASEPADWSGKYLVVYEEGAYAYVFNGKDEANGYVSAVIDGDVIKANSEVDAVTVTIAVMEGGYSIKTADGYISGIATGNKLYFNAEEQPNTIEMGTDGVDILAGRYLRFNSASGDMRFRYYNQTYGESVQLYKYVTELPSYQLTVTNAGWATLYLDFAAAIPAGVEAYIIKNDGINKDFVTLTQVTGVLPAKTGIIVKANAGDYTFAYSADKAADVADNLLEGSVSDENIQGEAYVLGVVDGEVGLYKALASGTSWKNNANKAYLPIASGTALSASLRFDFGGTTAIEEVETEAAETVIYDLTGRRVNEITKAGVYIINGHKVLVK